MGGRGELHHHCLHGGTPGLETCHCLPGYSGFRCQMPVSDSAGTQHDVDNSTINSLTVTIVSVSMVSLALLAALLYLVYFTLHRRRITSPFKHRRMDEVSGRSNNMEFSNRMFLQEENEEEEGSLTMEELEPSRNFVNPVYETMFQVSSVDDRLEVST